METIYAAHDQWYAQLGDYLRRMPVRTSRGMEYRETLNATIVVEDPRHAWLGIPERKLNRSIALVEGFQLLAGESYPGLMVKATKQFENYRDGQVFHGAYGPRLRSQIEHVISRIEADTETRQAVMTIWDPQYDNQDRRDIPCTLSIQFLVRDGKLNMIVNMRSNDVFLGLPYDLCQFSLLHQAMAWALRVKIGTYYHNAASLHLYVKDADKFSNFWKRSTGDENPWRLWFYPNYMETANEAFRLLRADANRVLDSGAQNHLAGLWDELAEFVLR